MIRTPLHRIRLGALVLAGIVVMAIFGYRLLGYTWGESLWMVVVTVSTVGYGERSQMPAPHQLFTVAVIVFGMSAAAYTFGGFFQMVMAGEIEQAIGIRRMTRDIEQLRSHTVICGYGRVGQHLAADLTAQRRRFVVIENDQDKVNEAKSRDLLCLVGDATDEQVLLDAGLERAESLVACLPTDVANLFITLTSRNLNPQLQIIARAEHPQSEKKLRQAGADRVVMPTVIGARQMVRMITRPSTADLMDLVGESSYGDLELDELKVGPSSKLQGATVETTEAHRRHRLLVVAVKQASGDLIFNPNADFVISSGDTLMIMGHAADIERFGKEYDGG